MGEPMQVDFLSSRLRRGRHTSWYLSDFRFGLANHIVDIKSRFSDISQVSTRNRIPNRAKGVPIGHSSVIPEIRRLIDNGIKRSYSGTNQATVQGAGR